MPTIKKPNEHFDAVLWTGNGPSSQNITSLNFQPDLVWVKNRSSTRKHNAYDSVRGTSKRLVPNDTAAEDTPGGVTAFNSNGFTVDSEGDVNASTLTFVGWTWKAAGASTVNTSGTISSNVSVNTTAGFSIVTYTGTGANATVGHGLGVVPKMIIAKGRGNVDNWPVYHASANTSPATGHLLLNSTGAFASTSSTWNNTAPTSTVFTVGTDTRINQNTIGYVAYCFAEVEGYSKFGSYTGNGSADGPFQYTGFRPKFILWKSSTDGARNWSVFDSSRNTYNVTNSYLLPNLSNAEGTSDACDFLSNGFKWRSTDAGSNGSGQTFIYMAFAEAPFKFSNAR